MLRSVLGNLFKKPATVGYPLAPKIVRPTARGHIAIAIDQCIFCGLCVRKCPTGALTVARPEKRWSIRRFECVLCGGCVECCPKKCLTMAREAYRASEEKVEDSYTNA